MISLWLRRLGVAVLVSLAIVPPVHAATTGDRNQEILSVVERIAANEKVIQRVRQKLPTLDERRLRLLATLAERLEARRNTPGANMALLLFAALITFD